MKKQNSFKLLTLVFTLIIFASLALNAAAVIDESSYTFSTNIPDRSVDRRDATSTNTPESDTGTIPRESDETQRQTGVVDDALNKASEALDDMTGALNDAKDDVEDAVDDTVGNSIMGVVLAIIIAVAIIILIIVMVAKNTGKNNRK